VNKIFFLTSLITSFNLFATDFNGYIVKTSPLSNFHNLNLLGEITKESNTSFGNFILLKPNKRFNEESLQYLQNKSEIEYFEPNYIITTNQLPKDKASNTPNDKNFKKQWALNNDGRNGSIFTKGLAGEDLNALKAWTLTKGSKKVKIAVIDSGIELTHPDLKNQIDVNLSELNGIEGVDDDGNGFVDDIYGYNFAYKNGNPSDGYGHGTLCSGILGASHNSVGVAGMMAEVSILPVKFLDNNGSGELIDAISAIDYALKRGANVLSNSWGVGAKTQALEDAINAANKSGVTFVTAAGNRSSNNDTTPSYPGNINIENVISVGSYSSKGNLSYFSNFGPKSVHVMAPGEEIMSTYRDGQYLPESGTSMSAPYVSGVIGLMLSIEPGLTPIQIKNRLINTSTKTSRLSEASVSGGRVDAYRALINK